MSPATLRPLMAPYIRDNIYVLYTASKDLAWPSSLALYLPCPPSILGSVVLDVSPVLEIVSFSLTCNRLFLVLRKYFFLIKAGLKSHNPPETFEGLVSEFIRFPKNIALEECSGAHLSANSSSPRIQAVLKKCQLLYLASEHRGVCDCSYHGDSTSPSFTLMPLTSPLYGSPVQRKRS